MCSCGCIGRERADQVLLRVPISFKTSPGDSGDVNAAARSGEVPTALKAVVETCHEYGRESVRRMVCTVIYSSCDIHSLFFFLKLSCVDCGTKFPSTQAIWTGYLIRNLGRKLDLAWSNSGRDPGAVYQARSVYISRTTPPSHEFFRTGSVCSISGCCCAYTARASSTPRCRWRIHPPANVRRPLCRVSSTKNKG
jgi:hypothetical protein